MGVGEATTEENDPSGSLRHMKRMVKSRGDRFPLERCQISHLSIGATLVGNSFPVAAGEIWDRELIGTAELCEPKG
jgi:hypothetical protein